MQINKREGAGIKNFNDSGAFIEYSNHMGDIYKNIQDYNPNKKIYSDIIADMRRNKKVKPIVS